MNIDPGSSTVRRLGVWALLGEPRTTAALSEQGFDWVCLDMQHGRFDDAAVGAVLSGRRNDAVPVWVRVRSVDAGLIGRALDAGAAGVIVPMVNGVPDALAVVAAAHYPPRGARSWGPFLGAYDRPALGTGEANAAVGVAVMVETAEALAGVEAIAATAGLTQLFVGPFDLAIALGLPVEALLADVTADSPLQRIRRAAERNGLTAGAFAGTPERAGQLAGHGYTFVAAATDSLLLERGAQAVLAGRTRPVDRLP